MKDQNILKVNKIGRVGHIITLIAKIIMGIAVAGVTIAFIVTLFLPDDLVTGKVVGDAVFEVNLPDGVAEAIVTDNANGTGNLGNAKIDILNGEINLTEVGMQDNTLILSGDGEVWNISIEHLSIGMFAVVILVITTFVLLFFVGDLCKKFEICENPFEEEVIKSLDRFEIMLIVWAVISMIGEAVADAFMSGLANASFSVNFSSIFMILIVYGLISVFKYGAKLQTEADETL